MATTFKRPDQQRSRQDSSTEENQKSWNMGRKELFLLNIIKDPENTLGLLATTIEDLHIHGDDNGVCGGDEIND